MKYISLPHLGEVKAGFPTLQTRNLFNIKGNEDTGSNKEILLPVKKETNYKNAFCGEVVGDSMTDFNIFENDLVIFKKKKNIRDEDIIICRIENSLIIKPIRETNDFFTFNSGDVKIKRKKENVKILGSVIDIIKINEKREGGDKKKVNDVLPLNKVLHGSAENILKSFPSNSVDIIMTSPPYDSIREYNGFQFDLHRIGKEVYRVLKDGGVAVVVIQDQTKNFGKTLTSFKTIIDWCDTIGFKLFECNVYKKYGAEGAWWNKRFRVDHEYLPIFLKGERPAFFDKEGIKIPSKHGGKTMTGGGTRLTNGVRVETRAIKINKMKCRGTVWEYMTAGDGTRLKHQHPATFPDQLPIDFINTFCPKNGIVLDPMCGSGTTLLAAKKLKREYIGIDISKEYCELSRRRIKEE